MNRTSACRRILVSRTDRAGDVTLTVPVFTVLKTLLPQVRLTALVRSYTAPLLREHPDIDGLIIDDSPSNLSCLGLARQLRRESFDVAILVHPSPRAMLAAFLARIPVRVGRASNLWQFLLTHRVVQHRSRNEKHEYQYNLDLIRPLGFSPPNVTPRLFPQSSLVQMANHRLVKAGLGGARPWFIHPGHGGSALNLSVEQYVRLADALQHRQIPVCVTCGPQESHLTKAFGPAVPGQLGFVSDLPDLAHLVALLSIGRGWSGASTGPMHLAAAVGLPVAAFFPPWFAMTPQRWGPVGPITQVFLPAIIDCPGRCQTCPHRDCMSTLDVMPAVEWISRLAL